MHRAGGVADVTPHGVRSVLATVCKAPAIHALDGGVSATVLAEQDIIQAFDAVVVFLALK